MRSGEVVWKVGEMEREEVGEAEVEVEGEAEGEEEVEELHLYSRGQVNIANILYRIVMKKLTECSW